jgi:hypothetical protein
VSRIYLFISEGLIRSILNNLREQTKNSMADKIKISNDLGEPTEQTEDTARRH